ncbi:MAG: flagellar protein FlgN [Pseudomonadota bacterium]
MTPAHPSRHDSFSAEPALAGSHSLPGTLRQMIAVLERERQALASLDADGLFEAAREKDTLCDTLSPVTIEALDAETRPLVETAQRLNDVNRRVRNLLSANVATRLEALGAPRAAYQAGYRARGA